MKNYTYYHNPRCSKSREGLALLEAKKVSLTVKLYLTEKITAKEIEELFLASGLEPLDGLIRTKEAAFKELELKDKKMSVKQWAKVVAENPVLLERPVLTNGKKAIVGRPPENMLALL
ncbi:arsenate reductase [Bacteriovorax sp. BSW11_IV]|uniref:arsenate reductase (glutaredoxin) n=1 Tax=Bacteriovorax sp. BSW11_IV TaxID=1353529 RepID=UPI000389E6C3|nr:arsenate reductase (glutaredoxin) [Bacteriovorax sp. BSW11_IV]EQC44089.1 arsenate reductase [Bacteriovorax sp. BSW11_IV]